jgi:hypothetical protein
MAMSEVDSLLKNYRDFVALPWDHRLAGQQKIWYVAYSPEQERRIRHRIVERAEFEEATRAAHHGWKAVDLTNFFAEWMADQKYREEYFEMPDAMEFALAEFSQYVIDRIKAVLTADDVDQDTVVALYGVGSLFGFLTISFLVNSLAPFIRGRLVVFFPGKQDGAVCRFLDARQGYSYHGIWISADKES